MINHNIVNNNKYCAKKKAENVVKIDLFIFIFTPLS